MFPLNAPNFNEQESVALPTELTTQINELDYINKNTAFAKKFRNRRSEFGKKTTCSKIKANERMPEM